MNGAEAAQLRDAIAAGRWGAILEVHVALEVVAAELDGRDLKTTDLSRLFPQWSGATVREVIRHFLTRQVLQKSGKNLFIQRDIERWQDRRGRKMFAQKGPAAALAGRKELGDADAVKPADLRPRTPEKPKPTTPEEVKQQATQAKLVGNLLANALRGAGPRKG